MCNTIFSSITYFAQKPFRVFSTNPNCFAIFTRPGFRTVGHTTRKLRAWSIRPSTRFVRRYFCFRRERGEGKGGGGAGGDGAKGEGRRGGGKRGEEATGRGERGGSKGDGKGAMEGARGETKVRRKGSRRRRDTGRQTKHCHRNQTQSGGPASTIRRASQTQIQGNPKINYIKTVIFHCSEREPKNKK